MTIRNALLVIVLLFGILAAFFIGLISVLSLGKNVSREAQERVNHDLMIVHFLNFNKKKINRTQSLLVLL